MTHLRVVLMVLVLPASRPDSAVKCLTKTSLATHRKTVRLDIPHSLAIVAALA